MTHWLYLLQNHFNLIKVTVKDNSRLLRLFHLKVIMINMVGHHWWASCGQKKIAKINLCAPLLVTADSPYLVQLRWGEADEGSPRYCLFQICRQRFLWNLAFFRLTLIPLNVFGILSSCWSLTYYHVIKFSNGKGNIVFLDISKESKVLFYWSASPTNCREADVGSISCTVKNST